MKIGDKVRVLNHDYLPGLIGKEGTVRYVIQDGTINVDLNIETESGKHFFIFKEEQLELINDQEKLKRITKMADQILKTTEEAFNKIDEYVEIIDSGKVEIICNGVFEVSGDVKKVK